MEYKAIIEIPKGCDRRIHLSYDGVNFIDLGPIKDEIPVNDGVMPIHYGYIEGTLNKDENDNVDVIIFSNKEYKSEEKTEIKIIGILNREDGDHKVIGVDDSIDIRNFEEVSSEYKNLILNYFGYKSKIISTEDREIALNYVNDSLV